MKFVTGRMRAVCALFAAPSVLAGLSFHPASADFISSSLGIAAQFTILETNGGNISMANASNAGFVTGNVGVNGGNFSDSGVPINGNVIVGTAATLNPNVAGNVTGTTTTNQSLLTTAANNAASASSTFAAQTATLPNTSVTGTTTINLASGVNVANLTSVNLGNGQTLTLNGPAGSEIILNDSGGVTLNSGHIVLTGGLTPNDVVFNLTGTQSLSTSGGLNNESTLAGIFLALDAQAMLSPGALTGEIISGKNISIASGGSVQAVPAPLIGRSFPVLLAVGGILFGVRLWERSKKRSPGPTIPHTAA